MKNQTVFRPIPVLTKRMFRTNRGRNLVAVLAILLTTMMFATLFIPERVGTDRSHWDCPSQRWLWPSV